MSHAHGYPDLPAGVVKTDGTRAFTGRVKGLTPIANEDLATKGYVDGAASSDASQLRGRDLSIDAPADQSVLMWDEASQEWVPTSLSDIASGAAGASRVVLPEIGAWHDCVTGSTIALGNGTANGNPRIRRTACVANNTAAGAMQCTVSVPHTYIPGTPLRVHIRYKISAVANVSSTLDCEVYHSHEGKSDGALTDLIAAAAQAINANAGVWLDRIFALSSVTGIGPGDWLTIVVKTSVSDVGGGGGQNVDLTGGWLILGSPTGWLVGQQALVGSSLVIN